MQGSLDWDDLRFLLAAGDAGSFAGAARRLRVDQATVGRRLRALQDRCGLPLVERTPGRLAFTEAGRRALRAARAMDEAATGLERTLDAGRPEVAGVLRITATDALASEVLAPRLPELLALHPGLSLELATGNQALNLSRRDADVAVRLFRPKEPALAVRRAGVLAFGVYASLDYLRRRGAPTAGLGEHDLIGYDRALAAASDALGWLDDAAAGARVVLRANTTAAVLAATAAGMGLGVLPCFVADRQPSLRRALPELRTRELWLAVHGDLRRSARVRVGLDFLARVLADAAPALRGDRGAQVAGERAARPARGATGPSRRA